MKCEMAVFDMAGTVVQPDEFIARSYNQALASSGAKPTHTGYQGMMAFPNPLAMANSLEDRGMPLMREDEVDVHARYEESLDMFFREDSRVEPVPGAQTAMALLHGSGVKIVLTTRCRRIILDAILTRLDWHDKIDFSVAGDERHPEATNVEVISQSMERFGVSRPDQVAMISDSPRDLEAGDVIGCGWNIGVTCGVHTADELSAQPHTHLVPGPLEAAQIILATP